jgi:transcriptional regulator with XRE-family HTH domain
LLPLLYPSVLYAQTAYYQMALKHRNNVVRWLRRHKGLSQKELARRLGAPYQTVQKWENGTRSIRRHWLPQLAEALEMPIMELERKLEGAKLLSSHDPDK